MFLIIPQVPRRGKISNMRKRKDINGAKSVTDLGRSKITNDDTLFWLGLAAVGGIFLFQLFPANTFVQ